MSDILNNLSLKQKIYQMFILGFEGQKLDSSNSQIQQAIKSCLGGVILFAQNFNSSTQAKNLITELNLSANIPLYMSIDQEGGLVERTIMMDKRVGYLTPMALSNELIKDHYQIMGDELSYLGLNMNFAPVLDVNTNPKNPIIGIRAFSDNSNEVSKQAQIAIKVFQSNKIAPVGKHFPGHGEAWVDSHKDMPVIDLDMKELEDIHLLPFKESIKNGLDALMIAHVHYKAFNDEKIPASLSKEVINDYLKGQLGYKGLIVSDDMVMGGITKHYNRIDAIKTAIIAGIDLFIFKDSMAQILEDIDKIEKLVLKGEIPESRINESVLKILEHKKKYNLFDKKQVADNFDYENAQAKIDKIAKKSIDIEFEYDFEIDNDNEYAFVCPNKADIFNYSFDVDDIENLCDFDLSVIKYSLNPTADEITEISAKTADKKVVFVSYNALLNSNQHTLYKKLNDPFVAVAAGNPVDCEFFNKSIAKIKTYCYKTSSLKAIASCLNRYCTKVPSKR